MNLTMGVAGQGAWAAMAAWVAGLGGRDDKDDDRDDDSNDGSDDGSPCKEHADGGEPEDEEVLPEEAEGVAVAADEAVAEPIQILRIIETGK